MGGGWGGWLGREVGWYRNQEIYAVFEVYMHDTCWHHHPSVVTSQGWRKSPIWEADIGQHIVHGCMTCAIR